MDSSSMPRFSMLHLQLRYMETCGEFMQIDPFIQALLHGMIGIGLIGTLSKLHKWDESAMFFDGSSLGMTHDSELGVLCSHLSFSSTVAYVFSIVLYVTVTIPSLRTIVTPLQEETKEIQVQALSVLCAGNVIIIVCLLAVLALQV